MSSFSEKLMITGTLSFVMVALVIKIAHGLFSFALIFMFSFWACGLTKEDISPYIEGYGCLSLVEYVLIIVATILSALLQLYDPKKYPRKALTKVSDPISYQMMALIVGVVHDLFSTVMLFIVGFWACGVMKENITSYLLQRYALLVFMDFLLTNVATFLHSLRRGLYLEKENLPNDKIE